VYVLAIGTLLGTFAEMLILAVAVMHHGYPIRPRWTGLSLDVRDVIANCLPFIAGTLILGGAVFVDQGFAVLLGSGGVAILNYGTKLTAVILAICGATVGAVSLPYLSSLAASEDWFGLRRAMTRSMYVIGAVSIPATAMLIWFSETLVQLYLQRGMFSAEMAREVALVQQFSLLQIPLGIALALVLRFMAALRANRLLLRVALAGLAVNALADAVLMRYLGAAGIAAADSAAALVTLALLGRLLAKHTAQRTVTSTAASSA
jgi:putative peptidoglycan lipid II flippase